MSKLLFAPWLGVVVFLVVLAGCSSNCTDKISSLNVVLRDGNALKVQVDIQTTDSVNTCIEYWESGDESKKYTTSGLGLNKTHKLILTNLRSKHDYFFRVIVSNGKCQSKSSKYHFTVGEVPSWIQDFCQVSSIKPQEFSSTFKNGYMLLYTRDAPGVIRLINARGEVVWYHQIKDTGFKTAYFTKNQTFLCILGSKDYPTSYGNEILELTLAGDTVLHLKKGENDFIQNVHHDVLLNSKNQLVTLSTVERLVDLSAVGGGKNDTVKSDGILVLDRKGSKVWEWTVFDALDPTDDKTIVETRRDWMHANSLNFDKDGNYLISFYNNGQIWKLDSQTGKIIWKFGKHGDFDVPSTADFDQGHSVHLNSENCLMLFDNGTSRQKSQVLAFKLNESAKKAEVVIQTPISSEFYNERMGSAYLIDQNNILTCCSKRSTVILSDRQGVPLWILRNSFMTYRVDFIPKELLVPYIED